MKPETTLKDALKPPFKEGKFHVGNYIVSVYKVAIDFKIAPVITRRL